MTATVRIEVDARQFKSYARQSTAAVARAGALWLQQGSLLVRRRIVREATSRFGVESSESRMQSVDPTRPKGVYAASVRSQVLPGEARIGPTVPYAWWIERGSEAKQGVPASHRRSRFIGHRPVQRGGEKAEPELLTLYSQLMMRAVEP